MNDRRPGRLLAALLLLTSGAASSCRKRTREHWTSPVVRPQQVPPGGWESAFVAVNYQSGTSDGARPRYAQHALVLTRGGQQSVFVLAQASDVAGDEGRRFRELDGARFTLRFSTFGTALELSRDQGATWRYVGLDTGGQPFVPFYCTHNAYAASAPWPETRTLALELLASTEPGVAASRSHGIDAHDPSWESELRASVNFVCSRRDDDALCAALVHASASPRFHFTATPPAVLDECVADCTRRAQAAPAAAPAPG